MSSNPLFTIFIPTYNRAPLLPRAFASIEQQRVRNFEVVIIDDGSTDNTKSVVEAWQNRVDFPVRYIYQENQGKPAAHNAAIEAAQGFFTVILDSDDTLAANALQILEDNWNSIPDDQKALFAGVEGHCAQLSDGTITGSLFPTSPLDSDYLETRHRLGIWGDKKNAIRTEVLREFPFPRFQNEKHVRESVVWNRLARKYRFRYINETIQYIEYQPDGLSTGIFWRRVNNPRGFRLAHQEMVNRFSEYIDMSELFNEMAKYIRYSLHSDISLAQQIREIDRKPLWLLALPKGYVDYLRDRRKMKRGRK